LFHIFLFIIMCFFKKTNITYFIKLSISACLIFYTVLACNTPQPNATEKPNLQKPFSLTFEQLEAQNKNNPKKSLIYIYDPMCEDCTRVRMFALENRDNEAYMQQHFYTATFLDENLNMIVPIKRTVTAEELEILLVFVATDSFAKMNIEEFQAKYQTGTYLPPVSD